MPVYKTNKKKVEGIKDPLFLDISDERGVEIPALNHRLFPCN